MILCCSLGVVLSLPQQGRADELPAADFAIEKVIDGQINAQLREVKVSQDPLVDEAGFLQKGKRNLTGR